MIFDKNPDTQVDGERTLGDQWAAKPSTFKEMVVVCWNPQTTFL